MNMIHRNGRIEPKQREAPASKEVLNRFAAYIGEKFRDFEKATLASLDGRFAELRRDFISKARSRASELARNEVENRIADAVEKALKDNRAERVALQRQVEALRDEVEKLRQQMGSQYR